MSEMQAILDRSVAQGDVPFVVALVGDRDGLLFSGAAGDAAAGRRAGEETFFRIFSMTKPVCAVAAMILVERGKLDLDTEVEQILPHFAMVRLLEGFDGIAPIFRTAKRKPTVRNLLTHTSGLEYELWNEEVAAYMEATGHPSVLTGTRASLYYPMMSEPGSRWAYGPNYDWLGLVVEAIDGRSIVDFCQEEIFDPLVMPDTRFELSPADHARLCEAMIRTDAGGFEPIDIAPATDPQVYAMGHSLYSTAPDYMRFLRMFLGGGELDGRRILSSSAVDLMMLNHIGTLNFRKMVPCSPLSATLDPFPDAVLTHSLAFVRSEDQIPGMRSIGSQGWAGMLNSFYWFDPDKDVAALFMAQSLPFADTRYMSRFEEFERAVYSHFR